MIRIIELSRDDRAGNRVRRARTRKSADQVQVTRETGVQEATVVDTRATRIAGLLESGDAVIRRIMKL